MMEQAIVRLIDMPCSVRGFVRRDSDGDYNIYINNRYPVDIQRRTVRHEQEHILRGDFDNAASIAEVESLPR